ncbi:MAG TPA: hypothetical protein VFX17_02980 [Patescibacteria group bacterium]|nr:hypothetical protein [Patescibacteria group bacterium]
MEIPQDPKNSVTVGEGHLINTLFALGLWSGIEQLIKSALKGIFGGLISNPLEQKTSREVEGKVEATGGDRHDFVMAITQLKLSDAKSEETIRQFLSNLSDEEDAEFVVHTAKTGKGDEAAKQRVAFLQYLAGLPSDDERRKVLKKSLYIGSRAKTTTEQLASQGQALGDFFMLKADEIKLRRERYRIKQTARYGGSVFRYIFGWQKN